MSKTQSIPKPVPMHGITRCKTHPAWRVCIHYKGSMEARYFRDKPYGGTFAALKAAKEHRDRLLSFLPLNRQIAASKPRRNSAEPLRQLLNAKTTSV